MHIAVVPLHICQPARRRQRLGALEHRRREIDSGSLPHDAGKGADHDSRTARHIQHVVLRSGGSRVNKELERRFGIERLGAGKRLRLPRELVDNPILMALHGPTVARLRRRVSVTPE